LSLGVLLFSYLFLPLFDPIQLDGYIASVVMKNRIPSYFGITVGFIAGNCSIYGIHVFASGLLQKRNKGDLLKVQFIRLGQYSKRRHPIYISSYFLSLCYAILMGSPTLVFISSCLLILLYFHAKSIEKSLLINKFGDDYVDYQTRVPKLMFSNDFLFLTIGIYVLFLIGLVGVLFFSSL
jgi:protein-S-isoprenylcysteine O-methyltransferase Ste14